MRKSKVLAIIAQGLNSQQWIQELKNGGGVRIFRFRICFDAPSHTPYVFVARVVNKIHNVNIIY